MQDASLGYDTRFMIRQREEVALRRVLLLAARDPSSIQDKIDCAEMAFALGLTGAAKALYDMAFIRSGFAPDRVRWQAEIWRRTGLWSDVSADDDGQSGPRGFSIDISINELKPLVAMEDRLPPLPPRAADLVGGSALALEPEGLARHMSSAGGEKRHAGPVSRDEPGRGFRRLANATEETTTAVPPTSDAFRTCATLCTLLRASRMHDASDELASLLEWMQPVFVDVPPFDLVADLADPERLAAAVIAADLRHFLLSNHALAFRPLGSSEILHRAARLEPGGLGPYFANVPRLLRNSRDIFAILQLAAGGPPDEQVQARWLPLLATHVGDGLLHDLVDELGDLGQMQPLWAILSTVVSQSRLRRDNGLLWRVRDAGLDNGEMALAACAQRVIASWRIDDKTEWRILGEILATAGEYQDAEHAFLIAWAIAPDDDIFPSRIRSLLSGDVADFAITKGFGTSKNRQQLRLERRELKEMI